MKLSHALQASTGSDWLLSDARILADSIGSETAFIICAESEEVQKRTLELEQQTASKLAEGGGECAYRGAKKERRSGGMRTRRCIESLGGACSLFPPKSAGLVALGNSSGALEGGLLRSSTEKGDAERAEKRGERGNPEGERAHRPSARLRKNEGGHGGRGCRECRECTQAAERKRLWGLRGGARVGGECGSVAEEEQKMHGRAPWGKLSFPES